jgi:predicted outer membrane repeat protein
MTLHHLISIIHCGISSIVDARRLVIKRSEFTHNNSKLDSMTAFGAAVTLEAKYKGFISAAISDSSFSLSNFNKTSFAGGAVSINSLNSIYVTQVTIQSCTFTDNLGAAGGAVFIAGSSNTTSFISIKDSTFTNNTASVASTSLAPGGGAVVVKNSRGADTTISNCRFLNNFAYKGSGGGLYLQDLRSLNITSGTFTNNVAEVDGGGVYASNIGFVSDSSSKYISNRASGRGGALSATNIMHNANSSTSAATVYGRLGDFGGVTLDKAVFISNSAASGGAVSAYETILLQKAPLYQDNSADSNGNALAVSGRLSVLYDDSTSYLRNKNVLALSNGGALYLRDIIGANIRGSTFTENTNGMGGAIFARDLIYFSLSNVPSCSGNEASSSGGCLSLSLSPLFDKDPLPVLYFIDNSAIESNTAKLQGGNVLVEGKRSDNVFSTLFDIGRFCSWMYLTSAHCVSCFFPLPLSQDTSP